MQRACAAALLRKGTTTIYNPGNSNDDLAATDVIQQLGATITQRNGLLEVQSSGVQPVSAAFHCGESGLGIRMFTPIAALSTQELTITGEGSLVTRPMDFFDEIMPQLGVTISSNGGKLPIVLQGPLQPADITIDGSLSSQFLTGLLMAYSAAGAQDKTITVKNLKSRPYIDLTLQILKDFGLPVPINNNYASFYFPAAETAHAATHDYTVEGDWSGAAFPLVAGAVAGEVHVKGIFNTSKQADKKIIDALLDAGAAVKVGDDFVKVQRQHLVPFVFDATDCPDLFPPLVALAANCRGVTRIHGLKRLRHKESDRGVTLQEEFAKLGIHIELNDDIMLVHGGLLKVQNHTLNSHHDHRIAMAGVVAALNADFEISIRNAEAVNKSYPDFYKHMEQLGISIFAV